VFQSICTRKKIEKYDFKKFQGSEGSNLFGKFVGGSGSGWTKWGLNWTELNFSNARSLILLL
jgi:hypothetical protein